MIGSQVLMAKLFGGQSAPPSSEQVALTMFHLASAFVALVVPGPALMGATLPLLARHAVQEREQIGRRIGLLYASNTLGAVAGALVTAFLLLPSLGLSRSIWVGAAVNLLVFLLAAVVARRGRFPGRRPALPASASRRTAPCASPGAPRRRRTGCCR